jgi:hypothetical protein
MRIQQRARTSHVPLGVAREALCKMQPYFDGRKATIIRVRDETACTSSSPQKEEVGTKPRTISEHEVFTDEQEILDPCILKRASREAQLRVTLGRKRSAASLIGNGQALMLGCNFCIQ